MNDIKTGVTGKTGGIADGIGDGVIGAILSNPKIQEAVLEKILGAILGIFKKKPVLQPGDKPVPNPNTADHSEFPDDVIPPPVPIVTRKIKEVRIVTSRLQYAHSLNPEMYTPDNKDGLYSNPRSYEGGKDAINIGAKGWFDLTAFDFDGKEFLPDAVAAYGLCYKTEHHIGDSFIKGNGGTPGNPNEGYETQDGQVGNGITSWRSTNGFMHQVKFHGEGTWEVWGSVGGVESNRFIIRVD